MHNKMQEEMNRQQQAAQADSIPKAASEKSSSDYIDFEEVK